MAMASVSGVRAYVPHARSRTARKQRIKVVGRAVGRRGHGRYRHDARAQHSAARAMPRPLEGAPALPLDAADGVGSFLSFCVWCVRL